MGEGPKKKSDRVDFVMAMRVQRLVAGKAVQAKCSNAEIAALHGIFQELTAYRKLEGSVFLDKIAQWCGASTAQVGRRLAKLAELGVIKYEPSSGKGRAGYISLLVYAADDIGQMKRDERSEKRACRQQRARDCETGQFISSDPDRSRFVDHEEAEDRSRFRARKVAVSGDLGRAVRPVNQRDSSRESLPSETPPAALAAASLAKGWGEMLGQSLDSDQRAKIIAAIVQEWTKIDQVEGQEAMEAAIRESVPDWLRSSKPELDEVALAWHWFRCVDSVRLAAA